jgi:hypothetical protein
MEWHLGSLVELTLDGPWAFLSVISSWSTDTIFPLLGTRARGNPICIGSQLRHSTQLDCPGRDVWYNIPLENRGLPGSETIKVASMPCMADPDDDVELLKVQLAKRPLHQYGRAAKRVWPDAYSFCKGPTPMIFSECHCDMRRKYCTYSTYNSALCYPKGRSRLLSINNL